MATAYYTIGIMSGTSLDGIDAVLLRINRTASGDHLQTAGSVSLAIPEPLRNTLYALTRDHQPNELAIAAAASRQIAELYAQVTLDLIDKTGIKPNEIKGIGAHGQTVRHRPELGYTVQLNQPALLAELTGLTVVADFRSRDIAAGGQGAPLVPAFHQAVFADREKNRVIANLGGIANLSVLTPGQATLGFDTGPSNCLLDRYCEVNLTQPHDFGGAIAATGKVHEPLLHALLADPYYALPPPKSTGREYFTLSKVQPLQQQWAPAAGHADALRTLVELTAQTIADALKQYAPAAQELYLCGGGVNNHLLVERLKSRCLSVSVHTTDTLGIHPQQVEAAAFAWLADQCLHGQRLALTAVTGASGARIYGAIWPA